ncbi:MAG: UBP-type zinc finger domain-containing protein [Frankiaceae bacterium]
MTPTTDSRRPGTGGLRSCAHLAAIPHLAAARHAPVRTACPPCRRHGQAWVELWLCLSCGWVACSDSSPNQHAKAHYEETDHPIARALRDGPHQHWCHAHQRTV